MCRLPLPDRLQHEPPAFINEKGGGGPAEYELVAPAGACMINWTSVWHRRTPNDSTVPRKVFWQVGKGLYDALGDIGVVFRELE